MKTLYYYGQLSGFGNFMGQPIQINASKVLVYSDITIADLYSTAFGTKSGTFNSNKTGLTQNLLQIKEIKQQFLKPVTENIHMGFFDKNIAERLSKYNYVQTLNDSTNVANPDVPSQLTVSAFEIKPYIVYAGNTGQVIFDWNENVINSGMEFLNLKIMRLITFDEITNLKRQ